jgi:hypothetical protein
MSTRKSLRICILIAAAIAVGPLSYADADEPSEEYKAGLRKTVERRKQRRMSSGSRADGMIVPYPMPPALIIRHTPEVHDEIQGLLDLLRYGSR